MDDFWSAFIQNLLMAFAPVLASLAAGLLYAWIRKTWAEFKDAQPNIAIALETAARLAVQAAEQAGAADIIADKKAYALDVAEKYLAARGLKIDLDLIDAAIEAAVYDEINRDREIVYVDEE